MPIIKSAGVLHFGSELRPRERRRMTRGRCGSLHLHRKGLAPSTPCRSPGALANDPSPKWRVHRSSRDHVDSCSGGRCHLLRSGSRQRHLFCRFRRSPRKPVPQIAESQPEVLAHHGANAGQTETASLPLGRAEQQSFARWAMREAAEQLSRALGQIATLPGTAALRREQIKLKVALANALAHLKGYAAPRPGLLSIGHAR
jgi:hypothetical protein